MAELLVTTLGVSRSEVLARVIGLVYFMHTLFFPYFLAIAFYLSFFLISYLVFPCISLVVCTRARVTIYSHTE